MFQKEYYLYLSAVDNWFLSNGLVRIKNYLI